MRRILATQWRISARTTRSFQLKRAVATCYPHTLWNMKKNALKRSAKRVWVTETHLFLAAGTKSVPKSWLTGTTTTSTKSIINRLTPWCKGNPYTSQIAVPWSPRKSLPSKSSISRNSQKKRTSNASLRVQKQWKAERKLSCTMTAKVKTAPKSFPSQLTVRRSKKGWSRMKYYRCFSRTLGMFSIRLWTWKRKNRLTVAISSFCRSSWNTGIKRKLFRRGIRARKFSTSSWRNMISRWNLWAPINPTKPISKPAMINTLADSSTSPSMKRKN